MVLIVYCSELNNLHNKCQQVAVYSAIWIWTLTHHSINHYLSNNQQLLALLNSNQWDNNNSSNQLLSDSLNNLNNNNNNLYWEDFNQTHLLVNNNQPIIYSAILTWTNRSLSNPHKCKVSTNLKQTLHLVLIHLLDLQGKMELALTATKLNSILSPNKILASLEVSSNLPFNSKQLNHQWTLEDNPHNPTLVSSNHHNNNNNNNSNSNNSNSISRINGIQRVKLMFGMREVDCSILTTLSQETRLSLSSSH